MFPNIIICNSIHPEYFCLAHVAPIRWSSSSPPQYEETKVTILGRSLSMEESMPKCLASRLKSEQKNFHRLLAQAEDLCVLYWG